MKELIKPYLIDIENPVDVATLIKKTRHLILAKQLSLSVISIWLGCLIIYINHLYFTPSSGAGTNVVAGLLFLVSTSFTFYGGWKLADTFKSLKYFYRPISENTFKETQGICLTHPILEDYLQRIVALYEYMTMADFDVIHEYLNYLKSNNTNSGLGKFQLKWNVNSLQPKTK